MNLSQLTKRYNDVIVDGIARSLWLHAYREWAEANRHCRWCERTISRDDSETWVDETDGDACPDSDEGHEPDPNEAGIAGPGEDWDDVAPETPHAAYLAARAVVKLLLKSEGLEKEKHGLVALFELAMTVDKGTPFELTEDSPPADSAHRRYPGASAHVITNVRESEEVGHRLVSTGSGQFRCTLCTAGGFLDRPSRDLRGKDRDLLTSCDGAPLEMANEFGHRLATMSLGLGTSWFDDHKERGKVDGSREEITVVLRVPRFEVNYDGTELTWSGVEREESTARPAKGTAEAGGDRRIRISFRRVTPGREDDDPPEEETGWEDEEGFSVEPDKDDREDGKTAVDLAKAFIERNYGRVEASSSSYHKGLWYLALDPRENYRTGERTYFDFHPSGFTEAEEKQLYTALTGKSTAKPVARTHGAQRAHYEGAGEPTTVGEKLGDIVVVNENDKAWTRHSYVLAFGAYGETKLLIYANGVDAALDEAIDWLVDHAPGHIVDDQVNEEFQRLSKEKQAELGRDLDDEEIAAIQEEAEQDTTAGGNASNRINSYEWTVLAEDPDRETLFEIAKLTSNPGGQWFEVTWPGGKGRYPGSYLKTFLDGLERQGVSKHRIKTKAVRANPSMRRRRRELVHNGGTAGAPANVTADRVRAALAARARAEAAGQEVLCSQTCRGWDVFETNREPFIEIEACDECNANARAAGLPIVTDDDVAALPEAQRALAAVTRDTEED